MDDHVATLKRQLGELIAIPSVSSLNPELDTSNKGVVDRLAAWFEGAGFSIEQQLVDRDQGKWNLLASVGPGEDGLVLCGHTDTVPFDAARWSSDPFTLTERDGLWYGLGAADMKSFFPIVLAALGSLDTNDFKSPLTVLATADEESSMNGARRLVETGQTLGRYGLIGEPTGLRPIHMHKGIMLTAIEVVGRSGHSSNPGLGNNALEGMYRIIGGLLAWREALQRRYTDPAFEIPQPTMNLGCIRGGDNPNRICASCELQLDLRVLPAMDVDDIADELDRIVTEAVAGSGLTARVRPLMQPLAPLHTSAEGEMVRVAEVLTGNRAASVAFGTEAPFLTALGVETIVLGPGDIDQAHQPDEFVSLARMVEMVGIVRRFIEYFCCHARLV